MANNQFITMNNGLKMPAIGVGTVGATTDGEIEAVIDGALEAGYRHIDTAYIYQNEEAIGKVLKKWFDSGRLKREDIFITTKLPMYGVHPDRAQLFIDKSLKNLQLDYVDLYLVHVPVGCKYVEGQNWATNEKGETIFEGPTDHVGIWKKFEELVDQGKTKSIGLSNYAIPQIETILKEARIKPANLQVELNIFFQQPKLRDFCKKNDISIVSYGPVGSPNFNTRNLARSPDLKHELAPMPDLIGDPTVIKIAQAHDKTTAQVLIRFLIQLGTVPIPKSGNLKRLKENLDVFGFSLNAFEMQQLKALDRGKKLGDFSKFVKGMADHPDYPFKFES